MIPERPRSVSERFRAVEAPKSLSVFSKNVADQICVWPKNNLLGIFEMDFGGVWAGLELILGGKRPFEVWRTAVFEQSESSEASPICIWVSRRRGSG